MYIHISTSVLTVLLLSKMCVYNLLPWRSGGEEGRLGGGEDERKRGGEEERWRGGEEEEGRRTKGGEEERWRGGEFEEKRGGCNPKKPNATANFKFGTGFTVFFWFFHFGQF